MIQLSVPNLSGNEWKYIKECLDTNWVSSVGAYVDLFEKSIQEYTGSRFAVAASSGTAALHISLILSGVTEADCVIVPNLTFIATLNAVKYTKATPILIDVNKDTWQMDLELVELFFREHTVRKGEYHFLKSSGKRVKAILPVHVLGNMCDMEDLIHLASRYNLEIIEDAAEALGTFYKGKHAGTFGNIGCLSFNGNKIITTGGGGMIITDNELLAKKAKHLTTQAKSDPFEYVHDEIGYNYRLVNILAAMGVAQMEQLPHFLKVKKHTSDHYIQELRTCHGIVFQKVDKHVQPNNWLFTMITKHQKSLIKQLIEEKIQVRPFWVPMNELPMFTGELYITNNNVAHELYSQSISLPCSTNISQEEIMKTIGVIKNFFSSRK
jgi:perosamine synthetase